jgi:hypothetical protein
MRHTNFVRTLALILPLACLFALPLAAQDSQDTSVADAARHAREQKKASAKPATVITNETLSPAPGAEATTSEGQQPPAATADAKSAIPASGASAKNAPATPEDAEEKKKQIDSLKQELANLQDEVDLAQRSLSLDQDAFYTKPDSSDDKDGKAKLDAAVADLKSKQDDLAQLKAKLADLGFAEEPKTPAAPPKP